MYLEHAKSTVSSTLRLEREREREGERSTAGEQEERDRMTQQMCDRQQKKLSVDGSDEKELGRDKGAMAGEITVIEEKRNESRLARPTMMLMVSMPVLTINSSFIHWRNSII